MYTITSLPLMDPILSQLNPIHNLTPYFFKMYYRIISQFMPTSSK